MKDDPIIPRPPDLMEYIHGMTDKEFDAYNKARPLREGEVSPLPPLPPLPSDKADDEFFKLCQDHTRLSQRYVRPAGTVRAFLQAWDGIADVPLMNSRILALREALETEPSQVTTEAVNIAQGQTEAQGEGE